MRTPTKTLTLACAGGLLVALAMTAPARLAMAQTSKPGSVPAPPAAPVTGPIKGQPTLPSGCVTLTVMPAQSGNPVGQQIMLGVTLINQCGTMVGLSNIPDGNLQVTSVTRDGVAVSAQPVALHFDDDLATTLGLSLTPVGPGASVSFPWLSSKDQTIGGQALLTMQLSSQVQGSAFDLSAPGSYTVSLVYQYVGPTGSFPGPVYTGTSNVASVTFTVS